MYFHFQIIMKVEQRQVKLELRIRNYQDVDFASLLFGPSTFPEGGSVL